MIRSSPTRQQSRLELLARRYDTDKSILVEYLHHYEEHFKDLVDRDVRLLELGVKTGGSLLLWRDYFNSGLIAGLDINPVHIEDTTNRIRVYQGAQQEKHLLDRIGTEVAPEGFDIIIDDCSHIGVLSRVSFWHLFDNHLKSGGLYIVEDWGTGYWDSWVDGVRHKRTPRGFNRAAYRLTRAIARLQQFPFVNYIPLIPTLLRGAKATVVKSQYYGMVGFVKELVDELGAADIAVNVGAVAQSKFREIRLYHSHLFVIKA